MQDANTSIFFMHICSRVQNFLPEGLPQFSTSPRASQPERKGGYEPCSQLSAKRDLENQLCLLLWLFLFTTAPTHCGRFNLECSSHDCCPLPLWPCGPCLSHWNSLRVKDAHLQSVSSVTRAPHPTGALEVKALRFSSHCCCTSVGLEDASSWHGAGLESDLLGQEW